MIVSTSIRILLMTASAYLLIGASALLLYFSESRARSRSSTILPIFQNLSLFMSVFGCASRKYFWRQLFLRHYQVKMVMSGLCRFLYIFFTIVFPCVWYTLHYLLIMMFQSMYICILYIYIYIYVIYIYICTQIYVYIHTDFIFYILYIIRFCIFYIFYFIYVDSFKPFYFRCVEFYVKNTFSSFVNAAQPFWCSTVISVSSSVVRNLIFLKFLFH